MLPAAGIPSSDATPNQLGCAAMPSGNAWMNVHKMTSPHASPAPRNAAGQGRRGDKAIAEQPTAPAIATRPWPHKASPP